MQSHRLSELLNQVKQVEEQETSSLLLFSLNIISQHLALRCKEIEELVVKKEFLKSLWKKWLFGEYSLQKPTRNIVPLVKK